jgi:hypothetical protein
VMRVPSLDLGTGTPLYESGIKGKPP